VTTAAGLAAAIPAVAGYNYFVARVRHLDDELEDFTADLMLRVEGPPSGSPARAPAPGPGPVPAGRLGDGDRGPEGRT
jgi:hypothetical protein